MKLQIYKNKVISNAKQSALMRLSLTTGVIKQSLGWRYQTASILPWKLRERVPVSELLYLHHIWFEIISCFAHTHLQDDPSPYVVSCV